MLIMLALKILIVNNVNVQNLSANNLGTQNLGITNGNSQNLGQLPSNWGLLIIFSNRQFVDHSINKYKYKENKRYEQNKNR